MDTVLPVRSAWGWCGLVPARVIDESAFGNLRVEDVHGRTWRPCPEDLPTSCLKMPGPLGGEYGGDNLGRIDLIEPIAASGDIARQIAGLPDGTAVLRLRFVD